MQARCWGVGRGRAGRVVAAVLGLSVGCGLGTGVPGASADNAPGPNVVLPNGQHLSCPQESFPAPGAPRDGPATPYEVPFTATLGQPSPLGEEGGFLSVANSLVTVTLGGPVKVDPTTGQQYGSVYAYLCGLVELPGENGVIGGSYGSGVDAQNNNDFVFYPSQINVALGITGIPGVTLVSAYGAADGQLTAQILHQPAVNGGLNVVFDGGAKSTSDFGPALAALASQLGPASGVTLPGPLQTLIDGLQSGATTAAGAACTLVIGNAAVQGVRDIPATGLSAAQAAAPVTLTTMTSGHLSGRPVTGPITKADATLVANDFPVGAIVADPSPTVNSTVPAAGYPGHPYCSTQNAALLNNLLGLPSIPDPAAGRYPNTFTSPGTFSVFVAPGG